MVEYNVIDKSLGKNIAGINIKRKLNELGLSINDIIKVLNMYDIANVSYKEIMCKLNGKRPISDIELMMFAKLLNCTIDELMRIPTNPSLRNPGIVPARDFIKRKSQVIKEINKLIPVITWHPIKPEKSINRYQWNDDVRLQLLKFYDEYGLKATVEEYGINASIIYTQVYIARKHNGYHKNENINSNQKYRIKKFINYYDTYGVEETAKYYGISESTVEDYIKHIK